MRRSSLRWSGLLFAAVVAAEACGEPKVATHIESTGKSQDTIVAGSTKTLTALVTDQNHDGMEGVEVIWTVLLGSGTISSTRSTTGGDGTASVTFTAPVTQGEMTSVSSGIFILGSASSHSVVVK
jgi:Bacterial Ig-like domain (group 1)